MNPPLSMKTDTSTTHMNPKKWIGARPALALYWAGTTGLSKNLGSPFASLEAALTRTIICWELV